MVGGGVMIYAEWWQKSDWWRYGVVSGGLKIYGG